MCKCFPGTFLLFGLKISLFLKKPPPDLHGPAPRARGVLRGPPPPTGAGMALPRMAGWSRFAIHLGAELIGGGF